MAFCYCHYQKYIGTTRAGCYERISVILRAVSALLCSQLHCTWHIRFKFSSSSHISRLLFAVFVLSRYKYRSRTNNWEWKRTRFFLLDAIAFGTLRSRPNRRTLPSLVRSFYRRRSGLSEVALRWRRRRRSSWRRESSDARWNPRGSGWPWKAIDTGSHRDDHCSPSTMPREPILWGEMLDYR